MLKFLYYLVFFSAQLCCAAQDDYGQFVDIQACDNLVSRACHQDDAINFLKKEKIIFKATCNVAQNNESDDLVRQACHDLYFATEIALHRPAVEINVQNPEKTCLHKVKSFYNQTVRNTQLHGIANLPQSMAICLVESKARRAHWTLYTRSFLYKEKQE
jgi:hypothetical protein